MDTFKIIYTLLGGLGIFFYGMKTMSDGLQSIAGDVIRKIINSLTTNRILAVLVGIFVTMIVQSSSVTTVMTVGFVNAGLMKLHQAIGVIFGSNIGTTVTGWIISIKIGKYGLLLIGLGIFPALFSKNQRLQHIGRALFGVGMVFLGLETMSSAFKPLRTSEVFLESISYFSGTSYGSYMASVFMGCLLTLVIQSSSAMLGITMALASTGVIQFHTAAALVLGENIGTTITALLASVGTNTNAKRAARAHGLFNVLGVVIILSILPFFIDFVDKLIPGGANFTLEDGSRPHISSHIAAFHSIFNISATLIFLPFLGKLAQFVSFITPTSNQTRKSQDNTHHLVMLGSPMDVIPATAIVQAHSELKKLKDIVQRMARVSKEYLLSGKKDCYDKAMDYERITDNIQKEVTVFLCLLMEKQLSYHQSIQTQALIRLADEYESVADYLQRIANYKERFKDNFQFSEDLKAEYFTFFDEVMDFFEQASIGLYDENSHDLESCKKTSDKLQKWADDIRDRHLDRVSRREYGPLNALTYSDMVVSLRKVRAHTINIAEAIDSVIKSYKN